MTQTIGQATAVRGGPDASHAPWPDGPWWLLGVAAAAAPAALLAQGGDLQVALLAALACLAAPGLAIGAMLRLARLAMATVPAPRGGAAAEASGGAGPADAGRPDGTDSCLSVPELNIHRPVIRLANSQTSSATSKYRTDNIIRLTADPRHVSFL